jgi:DNA (cytosine-5)-methyltransferase 1
MQSYWIKKIGLNRGVQRLWMQGKRLAKAGFLPGVPYKREVDGNRISLTVTNVNPTHVVSRKKIDEEAFEPLIDVNCHEVLNKFTELGFEQVRIIVRSLGKIDILPTATDLRIQERRERLKKKLATGEPLQIGSTAHGGGVLDLALNEGMKEGGVETELAYANEVEDNILAQSEAKNPVWTAKTMYLSCKMQDLVSDAWAMQHIPLVEGFHAGLPCLGASTSGMAKNKLKHPEEHEEVGHLVVPYLSLIQKSNPLWGTFENVVPYSSSASMAIIRTTLKEWGYNLHEIVLSGKQFNALEDRKRMVLVFTDPCIDFSFDRLQMPEMVERKLSEIMKPVPLDDEMWSPMEGLKAKEVRDKNRGASFAMQIFDGSEDHIGTLTAGIQRNRSTDPKFLHPTNHDLLRLPTPGEHANAKGIPKVLIEGMCKTWAHELLGRSVIFDKFRAVGKAIAESIQDVKFVLKPVADFQLAA